MSVNWTVFQFLHTDNSYSVLLCIGLFNAETLNYLTLFLTLFANVACSVSVFLCRHCLSGSDS